MDLKGADFFNHTVLYFKQGQYNSDTTDYQTPFGTYYVKRAIVPSEYGSTISEEDRSFEYALLELAEPIPGATPMAFDYLDWTTVSAKTVYTVGYPGSAAGVFANSPLVGGAGSPLQDSAYRWLNGGDSGLLVHSLDAEGGQSGSAIYVIQNNVSEDRLTVPVGVYFMALGQNDLFRSRSRSFCHFDTLNES